MIIWREVSSMEVAMVMQFYEIGWEMQWETRNAILDVFNMVVCHIGGFDTQNGMQMFWVI